MIKSVLLGSSKVVLFVSFVVFYISAIPIDALEIESVNHILIHYGLI